MSQSETALHLEELRDETARLQFEIEELKLRLSQYEELADETDESSTRNEFSSVSHNASPWSEWPYCWIVGAWKKTSERFHCFHENLSQARLTRHNAQMQRVYHRIAQSEAERRDLELL